MSNEKSKLKTGIFIVSIGLFLLSFFNICFCTDNGCRTSIEAFLLGGLAMFTGGAALTWMANPLIIIAWILLARNKKAAWIFSLAGSIICISFLKFHVIIEDEAGHYKSILNIGPGYWLWLSSCVTTFIGSLFMRILK